MYSKIKFKNKKYNLFAALTFPPLYEYDFSDDYYYSWFQKLNGTKYGMLDIIKKGFLYKYIPDKDFKIIKNNFEKKIKNLNYPQQLFRVFEDYDKKFDIFLKSLSRKEKFSRQEIIRLYNKQRALGSPLDTLLNIHHIFCLLFEPELREHIKKLVQGDQDKANELYIDTI